MKHPGPELDATLEDHARAAEELGFLLNTFAESVNKIVGRAVPAVGQAAGRQAARRLPVYFESGGEADVLEAICGILAAGFDMQVEPAPDAFLMRFRRCAIRDMCQRRNVELGGALCRIFHSYVGGITAELLQRRVVTRIEEVGPTCLVSQRAT